MTFQWNTRCVAANADGSGADNIVVVKGEDRFATDIAWLTSRHSFSFGPHYDPANTGFGHLIVNNDDVVAAGSGFDTHPHRDAEIVTWVLRGSLVHQDSQGNAGVIYPGLAQRMSAGRGILHSEKNDAWRIDQRPAHNEPVHFVQMWVLPDESGVDPGYEQLDINTELDTGDLVVVASGMAKHRNDTAIRIRQAGAALFAARVHPGATVNIPAGPKVHVFVADGSGVLEPGVSLAVGDSVRLSHSDDRTFTAHRDGAELLVWLMH